MRRAFVIEAGVSIECQDCGGRTTVPALKVIPGVKCEHCAARLHLDLGTTAAKITMLQEAAKRNDVKVI